MIQLYYIIFCLGLAYINYRAIDANKRVYHAINGILHLAFWGVTIYVTKSWFPVVALPFLGRLCFDTALNIMRGLPIGYVSSKPKAIMDKMEKGLFGNNGVLPKILYLIIVAALNIIYYATN